MKETSIEIQLDELFKLEQQLHLLLDREQYEQFQQLEVTFSEMLRAVIDNNSEETLNGVVSRLELLKTKLAILKNRAENCFNELKQKSLTQRRNKKRIKAYK